VTTIRLPVETRKGKLGQYVEQLLADMSRVWSPHPAQLAGIVVSTTASAVILTVMLDIPTA
jgi:hypothetical protein